MQGKNFQHLRIPSIFVGLKNEDSMRAEAGSKEPSRNDAIGGIGPGPGPIRRHPHHRHKTSLQTVIIHNDMNDNSRNRPIKNQNDQLSVHGNDDDFFEQSAVSREDRMDSLNVNPSLSSPSYAINLQVAQDDLYDNRENKSQYQKTII